jgi:hypothetical protein
MNEQLDTLTVGELIERLKEFDESTPVVFSYEYGDYWHSICANTASRWDADEAEIEWSNYHQAWKLSQDNGEFEDGEDASDGGDGGNQIAIVIGPKYN